MARTKEVYGSDELAHIWAKQSQQHGRVSNCNYSFNGTDLYSYSTIIARILETRHGKVILVGSGNYGSSFTSKHQQKMRQAISHETKVYGSNVRRQDLNFVTSLINFKDALQDVFNNKLLSSNKPIAYIAQMEAIYDNIRNMWYYATDEERSRMQGYTFTYVGKEKTTIELIQPKSDNADQLVSFDTVFGFLTAYAMSTAVVRNLQVTIDSYKDELRELTDYRAEQTHKWLTNQTDSSSCLYLNSYPNVNGYLRLTKKGRINTSLGITIPADVAKEFYFKFMSCRQDATACIGATIEGYEVNEVTDANIKIGCHNIGWAEAHKVARQAEWISEDDFNEKCKQDGFPVDPESILPNVTEVKQHLEVRLADAKNEMKKLKKENNIVPFRQYIKTI